MIRKKRALTILELMVVIAIAAIAGGGLFWRLNRLVEMKRVETDSAKIRSLLLSSQMLAINRKSDLELRMEKTKGGWSLHLISLEEPGVEFPCGQLSPLQIGFKPLEKRGEAEDSNISLRFSSTGQVAPFGTLTLGKEQIGIPAFFRQEQGVELGPIHHDALKNSKQVPS